MNRRHKSTGSHHRHHHHHHRHSGAHSTGGGSIASLESDGPLSEYGEDGWSTPSASNPSSSCPSEAGDRVSEDLDGTSVEGLRLDERLRQLLTTDPNRARRIIANRRSAARSKVKQANGVHELQERAQNLGLEVAELNHEGTSLSHAGLQLTMENASLRAELARWEARTSTANTEAQALREQLRKLGGDPAKVEELAMPGAAQAAAAAAAAAAQEQAGKRHQATAVVTGPQVAAQAPAPAHALPPSGPRSAPTRRKSPSSSRRKAPPPPLSVPQPSFGIGGSGMQSPVLMQHSAPTTPSSMAVTPHNDPSTLSISHAGNPNFAA